MAKSKSFTYPFAYTALMERAIRLAISYSQHPSYKGKYTFGGNTSQGQVTSPKMAGEYFIQDETITITINKKPMIVPWKLVQKKIEELLATDYEEVEAMLLQAEQALADLADSQE